jgi:hypothetical protein
MQDHNIRKILHPYLDSINKDFSDTIIVDELDLCFGLARVDIGVINGSIHGYEIKSEEDTLKRLASQINYYNKSLEKITIAVNQKHLDNVIKEVPEFWGIVLVETAEGNSPIKEIRPAMHNPEIESASLLQLLWKSELFSLTQKYDITCKKSSSRRTLCGIISQALDIRIISHEVRKALKNRQDWRSCSVTQTI